MVRTKHGLAEVIRRLYAHQLSIIWRKTLTTIQGKPQHNRAILPVSRLSNREHYVETIVTGMSLGWDLGTRTTRMPRSPPPQASGMSSRPPSTGRRSVWHSCHGPGRAFAKCLLNFGLRPDRPAGIRHSQPMGDRQLRTVACDVTQRRSAL